MCQYKIHIKIITKLALWANIGVAMAILSRPGINYHSAASGLILAQTKKRAFLFNEK